MEQLNITHIIIDDDFYAEESVTTNFTHNEKDYSVTFKKADLEMLNAWVYDNNHSLPANLSDSLLEKIREEVKKRI
ncbi:hypothetical protein [Bacillus weihaiensis]|uniref:Uncharacterized protein n=1 Tax=Bacillus weihaiensis TaxID=1547283 RepID=A0A1L3MS50_9BACI|nr:hypothetical protein [Bacillus weihaiensis]APH05084.1 hypothetical protein A9C19_10165 [Bacillus weihaiensis]